MKRFEELAFIKIDSKSILINLAFLFCLNLSPFVVFAFFQQFFKARPLENKSLPTKSLPTKEVKINQSPINPISYYEALQLKLCLVQRDERDLFQSLKNKFKTFELRSQLEKQVRDIIIKISQQIEKSLFGELYDSELYDVIFYKIIDIRFDSDLNLILKTKPVLIVDIEDLEPEQKARLNSFDMIEKTITILNQELINYFEVNFVEEMRKTLNQHNELLNGNSEVRQMDSSDEYLRWKKLVIEAENLIQTIDFEKMEHFEI